MAPELQIRCLGRLSLHFQEASEPAGRDLPLPATLKSQSLLAYLVVHRDRPQSRDRLAELFWGDRPEHNARRSLATALWQIRRCLPGDNFILTDAASVQFNPDSAFWLDVAEFEKLIRTPDAPVSALQQAIELVRGDFLDGFYDDWVLSERYRLESQVCEALARLMAAREVLGEPEAALAVARQLLEQDPLREDAHRAAMRAYCQLGNRHAALAQYARCEQTLRAELGVAPMAETLAVRRDIIEGRVPCAFGIVVTAVAAESPRRVSARHPLDVADQMPLVGREPELALLAEAGQASLAGECSLLLVSGEAGVGKTRLVQEYAAQQRWKGVRVLQGRCYEFERLLPYQPVAEAIRSLPQDVAAASAEAVPGWVIAQAARLAPDLFARELGNLAPVSGLWGEAQEQLFEGVSRFLVQLAVQAPLLLVLEDLHWATDSTLQLLHYLARAVSAQPVLMVGTLRTELTPAAHPLATLGRRLERDGLARRLSLSRLSAAAVVLLIGQLSGEGEPAKPLADRLYRETEGNPFYLIEMIKALFEEGAIRLEVGAWRADYAALGRRPLPLPAGISETIAARVGRLSEASQDAVRVAAVAGREFDFDVLNGAWGRGEEATLAALDELLRHRLIAEAAAGADYAFTHHKIQEVVYGGLPRHRRLHMHGEVGLAMERCLGDEAGARAVELAYHFEQARQLDGGLTDKAIAHLLQASKQSERQSAHLEAIAYLQRGFDILRSLPESSRRQEQELELQIALTVPTTVVHGYASPESQRVYDRAAALGRRLGDTPALFTALAGLTRYYGVSGDVRTGMEIGEEILALAKSTQETAFQLLACRVMGSNLFITGRLRAARMSWEHGAALYEPADHEHLAYRFGHDPSAIFHGYLILTLWLLGYGDQAAAEDRRLRDLMQSWSHPTSLAYARCFLAMGACLRRDAQGARQDAEDAIRLGESHGLPSWSAMAMALQGWAMVEQGRAEEGLARIDEGIAAWRARGFKHLTPILLALHAEACTKAHRLKDAAVALAAARTLVREGMDAYWWAEVDRLQGELLLAGGGDGNRAELHFRRALESARQHEARMLELRAAVSLAQLWQGRGQARAAQEMLAEVYGAFDEGFGSPDLQAAGALLFALSQRSARQF